MRNYIFDLDGTIIDSSEEILDCINKALKKNSLTIDKNKLKPELIGPPITSIIKELIPELQDEEIIKNIMRSFRDIYDNKDKYINKFYTGIYDILNNLQTSQKNLFIATNKPKKPTLKIIEQMKLNMFKDVYTIDKFEKPMNKYEMIVSIIKNNNLQQDETIMVGDSLNDILSAKQAGIKSIGVLWGYGLDKNELIKNADYIAKEVREIECPRLSYQII